MKVKFKVWLEEKGEPIISEGKFRLLKEIEKTGSILEASKRLGLTYKRAHSQIKSMERRLGKRILERRRGKGAVLTQEGKELLNVYEKVLSEFESLSRELSSDLPSFKTKKSLL